MSEEISGKKSTRINIDIAAKRINKLDFPDGNLGNKLLPEKYGRIVNELSCKGYTSDQIREGAYRDDLLLSIMTRLL